MAAVANTAKIMKRIYVMARLDDYPDIHLMDSETEGHVTLKRNDIEMEFKVGELNVLTELFIEYMRNKAK